MDHRNRADFQKDSALAAVAIGRAPLGSSISWAAIIAGVFIAITLQILLSMLGVWVGFGLANVTDLTALQDAATGVGIWIAVSALISLFIAGLATARLANSISNANALWHGVILWALALVGGIWLSITGFTGILGFALTPSAVLNAIPGLADEFAAPDALTAAQISAEFAGWFLLGALLALAAAIVGAIAGQVRGVRRDAVLSRDQAEDDTMAPEIRRQDVGARSASRTGDVAASGSQTAERDEGLKRETRPSRDDRTRRDERAA
jgi:hypothetical protein